METKSFVKLGLAIFLFGLAFLSKFDVVPLIVIIPLIIYKKYNGNVKLILTLLVAFFLSYFIYKVTKGTMLDRKTVEQHRTFQYFENPLYFGHEVVDNISAGLNSLGFYLKMMFWPDKMVCYYGYNTLPIFSFTSIYALLGLVFAGFLGYIFFTRFKKPDMLWYGVVIFSGFISMYLNVVTPAAGVVADRFLFFSSVGFTIMMFYFFHQLNKGKTKYQKFSDFNMSQKSVSIAVLLVSLVVVFNRNKDWKSKSILFEADVKKYPESVKLALLTTSQLIINISDPSKSNQISEYDKVKKIREAEVLLKNAVQTDSSCGGCYNNLSFLYLTYERKPEEALPYLKLAFKRDSTKKEVICNIGISYFRLGDVENAKKYLFLAIKNDIKNEFSVPYEVLQDLYSRTDINTGINFFKSRIKDHPEMELLHVLLGKTYFEAKDTANCIQAYKAALKINPNNRNVSDFVGNLEQKYLKSRW